MLELHPNLFFGERPAKNKGQSLIEAIVAIGIIVTAIVAILALGTAQIILGGESTKRTVATNLAREGIEVMIALKDSNRLDPTSTWPHGLEDGDWVINYNDTSLYTDVNPGGAPSVNPTREEGTSILDYLTDNCLNCYLCLGSNDIRTRCASQEVFKRLVSISVGDDLGGNCEGICEKKIISTVSWEEKNRVHSVSLEVHLSDWRQQYD
jgi:type II secretory pathway pseudopilin PulG